LGTGTPTGRGSIIAFELQTFQALDCVEQILGECIAEKKLGEEHEDSNCRTLGSRTPKRSAD